MGKKKDYYAPADLSAEEKEKWVQLSRLMYYDLVHPAVYDLGFTLKRAFDIACDAWKIRYKMDDIARAIDERFPGALVEDWEYDEETDSFIAVSNM